MNKFKTSLYLRISKEDDKNNESESIINQKNMLIDFVNSKEDLELVSIKIDDGYSGGNFDRPAFKELMEDVKSRKINCIVVKDFSRFGRDFIEVGKYLEEIFPFMNVRFISINDNYDSFKNEDSMDSLIIPFKNLINDSYLRDISLKVRSSLDIKRKNGEFIGSFATYGYLKDPNDKHKLIVDEVAAKVVRDIFKYKINGLSADKIAKKLNQNGVLSPMEHKKKIGLNFNTGFKKNVKSLWTAKAIFRILENPVYIGTLEQKKYTTPNYKIKKVVSVPKEERIVIENNHQPIIEKEIFENVQKLMLLDTRIAPNQEELYLLSGIVNCAECGSNLIRKNNGTKAKPYIYYVCNNAKNKMGCIGANIKPNILEDTIFKVIKNHIDSIINFENIINVIDNLSYTVIEMKKIEEQIIIKERELIKYKNIKLKLYEDLKEDILTKQEYEDFNISYTNRIEETKKLIDKFKNEIEIIKNGQDNNQLFIQYFKQYKNIEKLNRGIVVNFIEKIEVHNDKTIDIYFKYKDEFKILK
ncbi:recombinase family protein [[Clostridium] colinum]|uniref:recombinase family protein n=1 Tax=[Clostridium] colinum TaxID=36835 RepID=UPI0020258AE4|nr:recombinase family protein [[Clostridium] colinum]